MKRLITMLAATSAVLVGCAPDAVTNRYASGFNGYLDQIAALCKPLMVGEYDMTYRIQHQGFNDDNYNYFLDVTSQLYYQRSTPADYRSAINGFFGGGATTDRGIDCILAHLPADRPKAGPPVGGLINVN
jgi:hypothetical protein